MRNTTADRALRLAWPEGLAVLLGILLIDWPSLQAAARPFLSVYPFIVLGTGLLLGWRFGRGRLLLAFVALTVADRALALLASVPHPGANVVRAGGLVVALLLPLNLGALGLLPEAGLLSRWVRWWAAALIVQIAAGVLLCRVAAGGTAYALLLPLFPVELGPWTTLPQFALLAFLAGLALLGTRATRAPDPTARGLFWALIAAFVALNAGPANQTLYLSTAGLALLVAMVEASYSLAFQDELTGLPARRAFNQALQRLHGTYVVAMVDVDHFKQFNNRHGHDVGDQVLKLVASRLAQVGGGGRSFRHGGEEFAVLFSGSSLGEAGPHLEELREAIEGTTFTLRGPGRPKEPPEGPRRERLPRRRDLSVTVSIGAAASDSREGAKAVVEAADQALYRAKDAGRNCVMKAR